MNDCSHIWDGITCKNCKVDIFDLYYNLRAKLDAAEKYAELGKLALTTKAMICSNNDFIKRGAAMCEDHCVNFNYCQLRTELLAEVQKCST